MGYKNLLNEFKNEMEIIFSSEDDYEGPDYLDPYYKSKLCLNIKIIDFILNVRDDLKEGLISSEEYEKYKSEALEIIFGHSGCSLDLMFLERYKFVLIGNHILTHDEYWDDVYKSALGRWL